MRRICLLGEERRAERESAYGNLSGIEVMSPAGVAAPGKADLIDVFTRDADLLRAVVGALADGKLAIVHAPPPEWRTELPVLHEKHGGRLRIARPARRDRRVEAMLAELAGGEMGGVVTVRVIRLAPVGANQNELDWWTLDALATLGGAGRRVFCRRSALRGRAADQTLSVVRFANGAIGYAEASTAYPPAAVRTVIEMVTEQGMLQYDSATAPNRIMADRLEVLGETYAEPPLQRMLRGMIDGMEEGPAEPGTGRLLELSAAVERAANGAAAVEL